VADPWIEALQMLLCGLMIAAGAVPIGLAAWWVTRRNQEALWPPLRGWRVPWGGVEVFVALFVVSQLIPAFISPALEQGGFYQKLYGPDFPRAGSTADEGDDAAKQRFGEASVSRSLWVGLISLPIQLGLLLILCRVLYPDWKGPSREAAHAGSIALAVVAWVALASIVFMVHFGVLQAFHLFDWPVEDHPLARIKPANTHFDRLLFVLLLCVSAPMVEEVLFRGVLLPWLLGRKYRVWPVLASGIVIAAAETWQLATGPAVGPMLFAVSLLMGWFVIRALMRKKRRMVGAIYASAALFAVVHSHVWPSPVPLFVLGLGLGWLAVRTRGVLVPIIVHGLFNAVSVLFVLRSG
jgi:membrane protease YdiL (CAAX protease family)